MSEQLRTKTRFGVLVFASMMICIAAVASAQITINEMKVKSTEFVELHNAGAAAVDVTGWLLKNLTAIDTLSGVVPAGGFLSFLTTLPLSNTGDVVSLENLAGTLIDDVGYGTKGGAPMGFNSIGRSPDGADTDDWARDFEYLDDTVNAAGETPGASNVHSSPALGSGVLINELDQNGTADSLGGPDHVEIYNPGSASVSIQGYVLADGDGYCRITGAIVVPAGGFVVLTEGAAGEGMDCGGFDTVEYGSFDVAYLFNANNVRIDQLGYNLRPNPAAGETLQRCGDGAGPNDAFNFASQGGPSPSFNLFPTTLGFQNCGTVAVEETTWGNLKGLFREE